MESAFCLTDHKHTAMFKYLLRILPVMMALAIVSCEHKPTEKVMERHPNGQASKVFYYEGDKLVREVDYYEDGAVMMEGPMENGERNGDWVSYFPDGKVQSKGTFQNGVRTGKSEVYYENGHLWMEGNYKDGHQQGDWVYYDEQGYELGHVNHGD